jgi:hypothetical protein
VRAYNEPPVETLHLYVVSDEEYERYVKSAPIGFSQIVNTLLCLVCAVLLFAIPSAMDISPWFVVVPLQPAQTFMTTVEIAPTGQRVIPATSAHGTLTIYNGSILSQQLPPGFILTGQSGMEIATDQAVIIPAGNPPAYGLATTKAHVVAAGSAGNISARSINEVYGTSLYLKNLASFSGGADASTVHYATETDKQTALSSARNQLNMRQYPAMNDGCTAQMRDLSLAVSCQFVRYRPPAGLHVLSVQRIGDTVKLEVSR